VRDHPDRPHVALVVAARCDWCLKHFWCDVRGCPFHDIVATPLTVGVLVDSTGQLSVRCVCGAVRVALVKCFVSYIENNNFGIIKLTAKSPMMAFPL